MIRDLGLAESVPPWYLRVDPKSFKDLPVFAECEHLPQNRVDARFINQKEKKVIARSRNEPSKDGQLHLER